RPSSGLRCRGPSRSSRTGGQLRFRRAPHEEKSNAARARRKTPEARMTLDVSSQYSSPVRLPENLDADCAGRNGLLDCAILRRTIGAALFQPGTKAGMKTPPRASGQQPPGRRFAAGTNRLVAQGESTTLTRQGSGGRSRSSVPVGGGGGSEAS